MTLQNLKSKWWYRLLKVVVILFFILIAGIWLTVGIDYEYYNEETTSNSKSKITCNKGNQNIFTADEVGIDLNSFDNTNDVLIREKCGISNIITSKELAQEYGDPSFTWSIEGVRAYFKFIGYVEEEPTASEVVIKILAKSPDIGSFIDSHTIDYVYVKMNGGWFSIIGMWIIILACMVLIFEILRRLFYYIVVGKIKPDKE